MANGNWRISSENTIYNGEEKVYSIMPPSNFIVGELLGSPINDIIKKPILLDFSAINIASNDEDESYGFYPQYVNFYPSSFPGSSIISSYKGEISIIVNNTSYSVDVVLNPSGLNGLPDISFRFTDHVPEN